MSQVSLRRESAEAEWQTNIVYNYSFLPTSAFSCRAEPATPLLSECCLIKSLRPLRPLRAEKIHPCDGYISHAKSAENADSFLSLTQKYNSPARTDSFFSLTQNSPNTQIFLSARVGLRWRWNPQNSTSFTVPPPLTVKRSSFNFHRSSLTTQRSILRVSGLKLTPILYNARVSRAKGWAYPFSLICCSASSAVPFSLNSIT